MSAQPSDKKLEAIAATALKAIEAAVEEEAAAAKPAEGKHGVDGSIGHLLSSIGEAAVRVAQVPGKVHHERAAAEHAAEHAKHLKAAEKAAAEGGAAPEGGHAKGGHGHDKGSAEKHADFSRVGQEAYNLYKAWDKGEIEDKDVTDLVDSVLDWADIDWARPFVAPLGWGLRKVLGAHEHIHQVTAPEYSRLGAQILEWNEDKGGGFHHSYEGLVKGIKDVNALNRAFRHFHDKTIFDAAVKGDRPNLQKRIMALLGEEGDISEAEVRSFITNIMHRLGGHGHGVPPHAHIGPHHPLRPSLVPKHAALLKLYENAFNWLDKDTLDKIFSDKEPEKNFKIDFEHFGDLLLEEVNPGNRDRYLKSVNARTFEGTFKAKFPYLTNEGALKTALKKDTEREKVLTQLHQFTGVDYSMDLAALTDHVKILKERVGTKPTATEPLFAEYEAFERALNLVVTTMTNTGALTDLFEGKTEDASAKFEWTDEKYKNFGATILRTVNDKNRAEALGKFDFVDFEREVGTLKDEGSIRDQFESDPEELKKDIYNLFDLSGTVTDQKLQARAQLLFVKLGLKESMVSSPDAATDSKQVKLGKFIFQAAAVLIQTDLISKLFAKEEGTFVWDYEQFGANILTKVNDKNREVALKSLDIDNFNTTFVAIIPSIKPATLNTEPGRRKVKEQAMALLRLTEPFDAAEITQQVTALKKRLGDGTVEAVKFAEVAGRLDVAAAQLTAAGVIDKLFGIDKTEKPLDYDQIGADVLRRMRAGATADTLNGAINLVEVGLAVGSLFTKDTLSEEIESDLPGVQAKIANLFGIKGAVTRAQVNAQADILETALMSVAPGTRSSVDQLLFQIQTARALLTGTSLSPVEPKLLEKLYGKETGPVKMTIDADKIGETVFGLETDAERASFRASVKPNAIVNRFHALAEKDSLVGEFNRNAQETVAELRTLFGLERGALTTARVNARKDELLARLDTVPPDRMSTDALHKIGVLIEDVAAAFAAADGQTLVERLGDKVWSITYDQIANHVFTEVTTEDDQAIFLRNYKDGLLRSEFPALFPTASIAGLMGERTSRSEVKSELSGLFGLRGTVNERVLEGRKTAILERLSEGGKVEAAAYAKLKTSLEEVVNAVKPHLKQLFAPEAVPFETGIFGRALEANEEPGDVARFLTAYRKNMRQFNTFYHELFDKDALEAALLDESQRKVLVAKLKAFLGLDSGVVNVSKNDVAATLADFRTRLGKEDDLPDDNTKNAHGLLMDRFDEVEALLVTDSEEYLKRILKGNEVKPDYDALGAQIRKLDANPAKLIELLSSLDVARMVPLLTLRELPMTAASLRPEQVEQVETAIRNLIGIPEDQALTPTSFQYLASDLYQRLTSLPNLRNFPEAASSATSLAQTLKVLLEKNISAFFAKLATVGALKEDEAQTLVNVRGRSERLGLGADVWDRIGEFLSEDDLAKVVRLEKEGGEPAILGIFGGQMLIAETSQNVVEATTEMAFTEAKRDCARQGFEFLTQEEYRTLQSKKPVDPTTQTWLKSEVDASGEVIVGELNGNLTHHVTAVPARSSSKRRGYRRALRLSATA